MNNREAVLIAMKIFTNCYPGKFIVQEGMVDTWVMVLGDLDPNIIKVAALHLASIKKDWPPDMATLREQCLLTARGKLQEKTGAEAWERIREKMAEPAECEEPLKLTNNEKRALDQTASLYDLRHGNVTSLSVARSSFVKAYDAIIERHRLERLTLPEVRGVIEGNKPKMFEELRNKLKPVVLESDAPDRETIKQLCRQVADKCGI